ncbi:MAG: 3,4-dihydroxy-2-butanone-4-phosphate synthase, partial [Candidatus Zixiibacteriota bacterium]
MVHFNKIEEAIKDIREGKIVVVVDDEDRENEGDFIMAAEKITPEAINFMATHGRGLICTPMTKERLDELQLYPMVQSNNSKYGTRFTVSVDAFKGTTTGISAADRATTVRILADEHSVPEDLSRPGHIFPIQAVPGGVLRRAGHTETTVDLAHLAGLKPVGVLCEIMDEDGTMARVPKLYEIAQKFDLKFITVQDLIEYRRRTEKHVKKLTKTDFPTKY